MAKQPEPQQPELDRAERAAQLAAEGLAQLPQPEVAERRDAHT